MAASTGQNSTGQNSTGQNSTGQLGERAGGGTGRRPGLQTLSRIRTGLLIREARGYARLTQTDLAVRLGTTQSAVSNWERGIDTPRVDTLGRILGACGFEADLVLRHREDVDRSQIVRNLSMGPGQRARQFQSLAAAHRRARRATVVPVDA